MDRSRFCITGLPRSRTAWLSALLCAHGIETLHERAPFFADLEGLREWLYAGTAESPHGYVDGLAIIHNAALVKQHFADCPIVVIRRDAADARRSWEAWDRAPISDEAFAEAMAKVSGFCEEAAVRANVLIVPYAELESYEAVNRLVMHCTGRPLKVRTWQLFHRLKIEVHRAKFEQPPSRDATISP
jgi:hypothetical protein